MAQWSALADGGLPTSSTCRLAARQPALTCPTCPVPCALCEQDRRSKLFKWNVRLAKRLPWLTFNGQGEEKNPALSTLSDRSAIFEGGWMRECGVGSCCSLALAAGGEQALWCVASPASTPPRAQPLPQR